MLVFLIGLYVIALSIESMAQNLFPDFLNDWKGWTSDDHHLYFVTSKSWWRLSDCRRIRELDTAHCLSVRWRGPRWVSRARRSPAYQSIVASAPAVTEKRRSRKFHQYEMNINYIIIVSRNSKTKNDIT